MAITIKEALQLPIMTNTELIAGHRGINNKIKWVTIVEILEDTTRLQEGEFLITTGFGLTESEEKREQFINLLKSNKLSGVAIYTSFYIKEIPISFVQAANESDLPLIEIPTDINFSMITKAILEQIVNSQMQLLEHSLHIHRELTKLVLNNQSIQAITRTLSHLTDSNIILFDQMLKINHYHIQEESFFVSTDDKIYFKKQPVLLEADLLICKERGEIHHLTQHGMQITICPIIAKTTCYGFIVLGKSISSKRELDDIAIEHAATVYAIEYLKKQAIEETQIRLQGDFLEEVINQSYINDEAAIEQGKKLGYDLLGKQTVFYFTFKELEKEAAEQSLEKLYHTINRLLKQKKKQFILRTKVHAVVLLTHVSGKTDTQVHSYCDNLVNEIHKEWFFFHEPTLITGIGTCCDDFHHLSTCAKEAHYANLLSGLIDDKEQTVHFQNLGMYSLLIEMKDSGINLRNFYTQYLSSLVPPKHRQGADLINTLDAFLTNNQSIQLTSEQLFIHRHTLTYRLNQIQKKTGLSLKSADERMKLHLAILAYKLINYLEKNKKAVQ